MQPEDPRRLKCLSGSGCDERQPRCLESDTELIERWRIGGERRRGAKQEKRWCFDATFHLLAHERQGLYHMCFLFLSLRAAGVRPGSKEACPCVRGRDAHVGTVMPDVPAGGSALQSLPAGFVV